MTDATGSSLAPRLGTAGLAVRIALSVFLGIPLLGLVWEALNELLAGQWRPGHLLLGVPAGLLLLLLWRFLASAVSRWDHRLHA
jgi:hypothetical protein